MNEKPYQLIRREIDLPPLTAIWVLTAHLLTILSPLVMIAAIINHADYLQTVMYSPLLLLWAAGLFVAASIFETAQNTFDRWYLTGAPPALCDLLFNSLLVAALGLSALAYAGDIVWLWWLMIAAMVFFPLAYLLALPTPPFLAITGLAAALAGYRALQDPVIFFSLLSTFLTLFFLSILIKTRNQVMHGFTTIVNAVGLMATPLAIHQAATQTQASWLLVVVVSVLVIAVCLLLRKSLLRLSATPRL
jgi:hypothetical protein